jgi:hypothetical protein
MRAIITAGIVPEAVTTTIIIARNSGRPATLLS